MTQEEKHTFGIQNSADKWFTGFDAAGNPAFGSKEAAQSFTRHMAEAQTYLLNKFCASQLTAIAQT